MKRLRTQVAILGAGPAGLMLAHLLHVAGIESIVVELRSRAYAEQRIRAGVLEQTTVDLINDAGIGERMTRKGLRHSGIELGFLRQRHRIDLAELTGKGVTVYGQHEVVRDLIERRVDIDGLPIYFETTDASLHGVDADSPCIRFVHAEQSYELTCDYLAGCDGFHGICRPSVPTSEITLYERSYPFAWLGILAEAPPSRDELVYQNSPRGFALYSMRSPTITRLYLQCEPQEDLSQWSDDRIWNELHQRFSGDDGWLPTPGKIMHKGITGMRSFVADPMQYGRLFLLGDAAHIVPPTGAKGMNLALADALHLSRAFIAFYRRQDSTGLASYTATCLSRVWKVQRFSWWMTSMLHNFADASPFDRQRQIAELDYVITSRAAATTLAENYVGLPF